MQNLHPRDSVAVHLGSSERHIQLCRQNKHGEKFITAIDPIRADLQNKKDTLDKLRKNKVVANDIIRLYDMVLDDVLRKVHGRSKEYDRDFPGQEIQKLLFPKGKITPVVTMPAREEPDEAEQIASKIEALGADNILYPLAAEIRETISNCREADDAYSAILKAIANADTEVEIAKNVLSRQYANNYFKAASEFGKTYAERLFPEIHSSNRSIDDVDEEYDQSV